MHEHRKAHAWSPNIVCLVARTLCTCFCRPDSIATWETDTLDNLLPSQTLPGWFLLFRQMSTCDWLVSGILLVQKTETSNIAMSSSFRPMLPCSCTIIRYPSRTDLLDSIFVCIPRLFVQRLFKPPPTRKTKSSPTLKTTLSYLLDSASQNPSQF